MSVPSRDFLSTNIGKWISGKPVLIDPDRSIAFSEAINDPIAEHTTGKSVTPMFSVVPIYNCMFQAVDAVTPEDLRPLIVHGSHDIHIQRPLRVGSTLHARAQVTGLHAVSVGTAVSVRIDVLDDHEARVSQQWAIALVRGAATTLDDGTAVPKVDLTGDAGLASTGVVDARRETSLLSADQTRRFSKASGDTNAVHLDDDVARSVGFDGVILHGLCTMGIASGAAMTVCCATDPRRLRRLAVRLAAPAYPHGELTSEFKRLGEHRYGLETVTSTGVAVIRRGLVEVAPAP
jgi:acyl dehydratase